MNAAIGIFTCKLHTLFFSLKFGSHSMAYTVYERFLKLLEIPRELVWKPTLNNEWSSKKISRGVECKPKPSHSFGQDALKEKLSHSVLCNRINKMQSKE